MSLGVLLLVIAVCLIAESFFTGTELAVIHVDKLKLRGRARRGGRSAALLLRFLQRPGWFFSATLLGTNLAVVTASVCTTYYIVYHFGGEREGWALLLSPLLLIFGEIVPKSVYQHYANTLAYKAAIPVQIFGSIFYPVVWFLAKLNDIFLGRASKQYLKEPPVTREELESFLKEGPHPEGQRLQLRRTMISKIFDLADKRVANIMVPLVEVKALSVHTTPREIGPAFEAGGHSRMPVFEERIVNIVGILHNTDALLAEEKKGVRELMRPAYFVPEEMPLDDLFIMMKRKGEPMAVVVDEYGGASGIVTLEDLLEEVVGDIEDEYDRPLPLYYRLAKNRFLVSGRLQISEANEKLNLGLPEGDYETIAGFLIHKIGRIPKVGEKHVFGGLQFTIRRATEKAIQDVEIFIGP